MTSLDRINTAAQAGQLLPGTAQNLAASLQADLPTWAKASIDELVGRQEWNELNYRFYRFLEFGTGGMRGRTSGVVGAPSDVGRLSGTGAREHAAIGSSRLNDF